MADIQTQQIHTPPPPQKQASNTKILSIIIAVVVIFIALVLIIGAAVKLIAWKWVGWILGSIFLVWIIVLVTIFIIRKRKGKIPLPYQKQAQPQEMLAFFKQLLADDYFDGIKERMETSMNNVGDPPTKVFLARVKSYEFPNISYVGLFYVFDYQNQYQVLINPSSMQIREAMEKMMIRPDIYEFQREIEKDPITGRERHFERRIPIRSKTEVEEQL